MGQEISNNQYEPKDFQQYRQRLIRETDLLINYIKNDQFSHKLDVGGFELEAWLVDDNGSPAPVNERFLEVLDNPMVVHELAAFNFEINVHERNLSNDALSQFKSDLTAVWDSCCSTAQTINSDCVAIGVLPSVRDSDLNLQNISDSKRYLALNEQVLEHRGGKPIQLDIKGTDHLLTSHYDVMLEAAATSLQIHLQIPIDIATRAFNASTLISGPMVAVSANSPYVFGNDLWDESRIPLFEQSVFIGDSTYRRVNFGQNYLKNSISELFVQNLEDFSILLPNLFDSEPDQFKHLQLHNGTIWRWNRPLIGFDSSGKPHLRIEHRIVSSGPTITDIIANAAFYWGLISGIIKSEISPESVIDFDRAKENFYRAARYGLGSKLNWRDGRILDVKEILVNELIPLAKKGLGYLNIDSTDINYYLDIIEARVMSDQNGAIWQRKWVKKFGHDMDELTRSYIENQRMGHPVHSWKI